MWRRQQCSVFVTFAASPSLKRLLALIDTHFILRQQWVVKLQWWACQMSWDRIVNICFWRLCGQWHNIESIIDTNVMTVEYLYYRPVSRGLWLCILCAESWGHIAISRLIFYKYSLTVFCTVEPVPESKTVMQGAVCTIFVSCQFDGLWY